MALAAWHLALLPACVAGGLGPRLYLDVSCGQSAPKGRVLLHLDEAATVQLPRATENMRLLFTGERSPINPSLTYANCAFVHTPASMEASAQYRWAHVLRGPKVAALPGGSLDSPAHLSACAHDLNFPGGGRYYGACVDPNSDPAEGGTVVAVPVAGPGAGKSRLVIIRVAESPATWRERLLINLAVLGHVAGSESQAMVRAMAQSREAPVVCACGLLDR